MFKFEQVNLLYITNYMIIFKNVFKEMYTDFLNVDDIKRCVQERADSIVHKASYL
jgi:hypothetical protein